MYRPAWTLVTAGVVVCDAGIGHAWLAAAAAGSVVAGCGVALHNARRLEARWRHHGVRGELFFDAARIGFSGNGNTRCALGATVHAPDRPADRRVYQALVPNIDIDEFQVGRTLPVAVLTDDPGVVRLHLRPETYVLLRGR